MCGAPYDYFNLNDLERLDMSRYKMVVFLNSFRISNSIRKAIDEKLSGRMKVWIHAPNIASGEVLKQEGIEKLIDMKLEKVDGSVEQPILFEGKEFGFSHPMSPMYKVADDAAETLATYVKDGGAAVVQKGEHVYIGAGNVPKELWRALAERAGVHVYTAEDGALYADRRMVAFQPHTGGLKSIRLPEGNEMEELFEGIHCWVEGNELRFEAEANHVYLFLKK